MLVIDCPQRGFKRSHHLHAKPVQLLVRVVMPAEARLRAFRGLLASHRRDFEALQLRF